MILARAVIGLLRDVDKGARSPPLRARRCCRRQGFASCCYATENGTRHTAKAHRRDVEGTARAHGTAATATCFRKIIATPVAAAKPPARSPLPMPFTALVAAAHHRWKRKDRRRRLRRTREGKPLPKLFFVVALPDSKAIATGTGEKPPTPPVELTAPAGVLCCWSRGGCLQEVSIAAAFVDGNREEVRRRRGSPLMVDWRCSALNEKKRRSPIDALVAVAAWKLHRRMLLCRWRRKVASEVGVAGRSPLLLQPCWLFEREDGKAETGR
nr:hypothetical protein Iba_chr13dCG3870 [Ipomoea batatas]